jgi:hypothetical protein
MNGSRLGSRDWARRALKSLLIVGKPRSKRKSQPPAPTRSDTRVALPPVGVTSGGVDESVTVGIGQAKPCPKGGGRPAHRTRGVTVPPSWSAAQQDQRPTNEVGSEEQMAIR